MWFACCNAPTVVPYRPAMPLNVSPLRTVYEAPPDDGGFDVTGAAPPPAPGIVSFWPT